MFYHTPPTGLYQEYQERVSKAVRTGMHARDAQAVAQPDRLMWRRFRAWLATERARFERALQPAEEGYIA